MLGHGHIYLCTWCHQDTLWELVFSFLYVGPRKGTQIGSKGLYPLSHLAGLYASPFNIVALIAFQLRDTDIQSVARGCNYIIRLLRVLGQGRQ